MQIEAGTAFELVLSVLPVVDDLGRPRLTEGQHWHSQARNPAFRAERAILRRIGREPFINLLGAAFECASPRSGASFVEHLQRLSADEVVLNLVGGYRRTVRRGTPPETIRAAVSGDRSARQRFRATSMPDVGHWQASLKFLLSGDASDIAGRAIDALAAWHALAFQPEEARLSDAQSRRRQLLLDENEAWTFEPLLARVLPGIDYMPPAGIDEVVFVPSVVVRPSFAFLDHRMASIVVFPITEPPSAGDAPPEQLVRLGKALGDELRLRTLHALADGPRSLGDLARQLGVPRTTLSHHIGILRSAGLVGMGIDDGRWGRLRLRIESAEEGPRLLRDYLTGVRSASPHDD